MPPEILSLLFNEEPSLSLVVVGSVSEGLEIKYELFDADTMVLVSDSGWIEWSPEGYTFEGVDQYTSYAIRYGFSNGDWTFIQTRHNDEYVFTNSDLILSMVQLNTQSRSERIGRTNHEYEIYHNVDFDRMGGAI